MWPEATQAATTAISFYEKISRANGPHKALIAVTRKVLRRDSLRINKD
jgi:hypothetical protein